MCVCSFRLSLIEEDFEEEEDEPDIDDYDDEDSDGFGAVSLVRRNKYDSVCLGYFFMCAFVIKKISFCVLQPSTRHSTSFLEDLFE